MLTTRVIEEPSLNTREHLTALAKSAELTLGRILEDDR
jgi:hypothetical protein